MDIHALTSFFQHIPLDWILIAIFFALATFDALRSGVTRAAALTLALPITGLFLQYMPNTAYLAVFDKQFSAPVPAAVMSAVVFVILFMLINRMTDSFGDSGHILQAALAGAALTAVVLVVWLEIPALNAVYHFGPQVQTVFGAAYRLWWLLAAYIALAYVRT